MNTVYEQFVLFLYWKNYLIQKVDHHTHDFHLYVKGEQLLVKELAYETLMIYFPNGEEVYIDIYSPESCISIIDNYYIRNNIK